MCNARPPLVRDNKGEHTKTSHKDLKWKYHFEMARGSRIIPWNLDEREKEGMQNGEEEWIPKRRYYD